VETVALYDAKNRLSELCSRVEETGVPCVISRRGKPVVKLVPVDDSGRGSSVWDTVEEAQAKYGELDAELELSERSGGMRPNPFDE